MDHLNPLAIVQPAAPAVSRLRNLLGLLRTALANRAFGALPGQDGKTVTAPVSWPGWRPKTAASPPGILGGPSKTGKRAVRRKQTDLSRRQLIKARKEANRGRNS